MPVLVPAPLPTRKSRFREDSRDAAAPFVWTIDSFLSTEECAALVSRFDAMGFAAAPLNTSTHAEMHPEVRNNSRVMFDDTDLSARLFKKVHPHLPATMYAEALRPSAVNERFRGYRYEPGERFKPHFDGTFRRDEREESLLTFMVYLNEGFAGGATRFVDLDVDVAPRTGLAILFQHLLLHEGLPVVSGTKYVLRSDVLYRLP